MVVRTSRKKKLHQWEKKNEGCTKKKEARTKLKYEGRDDEKRPTGAHVVGGPKERKTCIKGWGTGRARKPGYEGHESGRSAAKKNENDRNGKGGPQIHGR